MRLQGTTSSTLYVKTVTIIATSFVTIIVSNTCNRQEVVGIVNALEKVTIFFKIGMVLSSASKVLSSLTTELLGIISCNALEATL